MHIIRPDIQTVYVLFHSFLSCYFSVEGAHRTPNVYELKRTGKFFHSPLFFPFFHRISERFFSLTIWFLLYFLDFNLYFKNNLLICINFHKNSRILCKKIEENWSFGVSDKETHVCRRGCDLIHWKYRTDFWVSKFSSPHFLLHWNFHWNWNGEWIEEISLVCESEIYGCRERWFRNTHVPWKRAKKNDKNKLKLSGFSLRVGVVSNLGVTHWKERDWDLFIILELSFEYVLFRKFI